MLLTVPENHRYWLEAGESWDFFWLSMSGAEALRIHLLIQKVTGPIFRPRPGTLDRLAALCLRLIDSHAEQATAASAVAYEAAMALFEDVFGTAADEASLPPPIARVMRHVGSHSAGRLDVDGMAEIAGLSRAHFSRLFAAAVGLPPAEYLMNERMRLAARLIGSDASLGVKQVAARTGFDDPNYFAKAFRRAFGVSPTEFRASGMYFDGARPR
jgi:transcriptional regulator GlxA family with amidase domain